MLDGEDRRQILRLYDDLCGRYGLVEDGYRLSETQTQAILDLRLHQLTGLEQDKIVDEYKQLLEEIDRLLEILADPDRLIGTGPADLQAGRRAPRRSHLGGK